MANLLTRRAPPDPFPALSPDQLDRLGSRLASVASLDAAKRSAIGRRAERELEAELEELERVPALVTAHQLLERLDSMRSDAGRAEPVASASRGSGRRGLILYRPGRSLETGEAEVASRGYFDALDRPPVASWLEVIGRPARSTGGDFEIALLCWLATEDLARARAGCEACPSGALSLLDDSFEELWAGIQPLLGSDV